MTCRVDTNWTYHGLCAVRLENKFIAVTVLPERGANIIDITDKSRDRNLLWRSKRIKPHAVNLKADFDDHWAGGWDDIFPTGRPCKNEYGDPLPYLGEIWSIPHDFIVLKDNDDVVQIKTFVKTPITPAYFSRTITLNQDSDEVVFEYEIKNIGTMPFRFQWGIHPVFAVTPQSRVILPSKSALVDEWLGGAFGEEGETFQWPHHRGIDMRQPFVSEERSLALHYLDTEKGNSFVLADYDGALSITFDRTTFSCLWYLINNGASRGDTHLAIEPWTSAPSGLSNEPVLGEIAQIEAGDIKRATVKFKSSYDQKTVIAAANLDQE